MLVLATVYASMALIAAGSDVPAWLPDSLRNTKSFELIDTTRRTVALTRVDDGAHISITVVTTPLGEADHKINTQKLRPHTQYLPASGYHIAKQSIVENQAGMYLLIAVNDYEKVTFTMNGPRQSYRHEKGVARWSRPDDFTKDGPWVESMVRQCLNNYALRRVGKIGTTSVNGKSVQSFTMSMSGERYVDLEAWSSAKGVSISRNDKELRASLSLGGRSVVVTLGSSRAKVGSEWKPMPDVMVAFNGKIWVPVKFLESN